MGRSARSTRFPVAMHIMCLLMAFRRQMGDSFLSSRLMAASLGKNETIARQIVGMLMRAGLVRSAAGSKGGASLAKDPAEITLLEIYKAVEAQEIFSVHHGDPRCPVANFVEDYMSEFFQKEEERFEHELAAVRLSDLGAEFDARGFDMTFPPEFFARANAAD